MAEEPKPCYPACDSFKCGQRALTQMGQRIYCRWADDDCSGPRCNYALCLQKRLLAGGICGLTVRRKTKEELAPEATPGVSVLVKGKLLRRFREDELI